MQPGGSVASGPQMQPSQPHWNCTPRRPSGQPMFLTYLDDAGSAKTPDEECLVLGGVCISEHQVNDLTHALEALAAKYDAAAPDTVEFHASAIYTGKVKPWDGLKKPEERREVLKKVLTIVRGAPM